MLLEHHRQDLADRLHQPAEAGALVAVLVTAVQARTLALAAEGGEVAEHGQQHPVQLLRMHLLQSQVVAQQQLGAIDQLQHHEIADLRAADLAIGPDTLGDGVAAMAEHADHFLQAGQQVGGCVGVEVARHEVGIEADHPVRCGIQHHRHLQFDVGLVALLLAEQQAKIRPRAADLHHGILAGVGVRHLQVVGGIARQDLGLLRPTRLDVVSGDQRQGQGDRHVRGIGRHVEGERLGIAAEFEQAAVGQYAGGLADHQLAHVEELAVQLQGEEAPVVAAQQLGPGLHLVVVVAVVVLQVLRAQQHAFLPDDLVHVHRASPALPSSSPAFRMPFWPSFSSTRVSSFAVTGTT